MLLIWDEIQTGFGRLGEIFCDDLHDTVPDILIFGKAIGAGFPLAGSLMGRDVQGFRLGGRSFALDHFPVATLTVMEDEDMLGIQLVRDRETKEPARPVTRSLSAARPASRRAGPLLTRIDSAWAERGPYLEAAAGLGARSK